MALPCTELSLNRYTALKNNCMPSYFLYFCFNLVGCLILAKYFGVCGVLHMALYTLAVQHSHASPFCNIWRFRMLYYFPLSSPVKRSSLQSFLRALLYHPAMRAAQTQSWLVSHGHWLYMTVLYTERVLAEHAQACTSTVRENRWGYLSTPSCWHPATLFIGIRVVFGSWMETWWKDL